MYCDPSSESQKKVVIQCAYNAKMPPEAALIFVQASFAPVTLDEVIELYKSFEGDEQKSIDDKNQTNSASLENSSAEEMESDQGSPRDSDESQEKKDYFTTVANEILGEILKYSSIEDQKMLHQTCFRISSYIATQFQSYEFITVLIGEAKIQIELKEQKAPITRPFEVKIKLGTRTHDDNKVVEEEKFKTFSFATDSDALTKLQSILHLPNKTPIKIGILNIKIDGWDRLAESRSFEFYSGFQKILNDVKPALHVEKLVITINDPESLLAILNRLRPGPLTSIDLSDVFYEDHDPFNMKKIVDSEHWQYIKTLDVTMFCLCDISLADLVNLENVFIEVDDFTVEDMLNYKNKLLQFPMRRSHTIAHSYGVDGLIDALIPFQTVQDHLFSHGSFLDNNKQRLRVLHNKSETTFECP